MTVEQLLVVIGVCFFVAFWAMYSGILHTTQTFGNYKQFVVEALYIYYICCLYILIDRGRWIASAMPGFQFTLACRRFSTNPNNPMHAFMPSMTCPGTICFYHIACKTCCSDEHQQALVLTIKTFCHNHIEWCRFLSLFMYVCSNFPLKRWCVVCFPFPPLFSENTELYTTSLLSSRPLCTYIKI